MKAKHTQGDWDICTIDNGDADDEICTYVNGCLVNVAAVFSVGEFSMHSPDGNEPHYTVSKEEAQANGRLLAAAPRLLDALERLMAHTERYFSFGDVGGAELKLANLVRFAIAEAKGD